MNGVFGSAIIALYTVDDARRNVEVTRIAHRNEVYER